METYENIVAGTWFVVALYLLIGLRRPQLRLAGVGVLPFVLLSLGVASTLPTAVTPVTAPYRSIWLGVHVTFAWATYAAYTLCASLAFLELMKGRRGFGALRVARAVPGPRGTGRADAEVGRLRLPRERRHDRVRRDLGARPVGRATGSGTRSRRGAC